MLNGSWRAVTASHLRLWFFVVVAAVGLGTLGYVIFLQWSLSDALYMTVISLTTVGFKEVRELDGVGRAWTMALAVAGVGIIFGSVGLVAETVLSEFASGNRERRRMAKAIEELRDHFVLCGYGRVGSEVARQLVQAGQRLVVIDPTESSLARARRDGHFVIDGDATDDQNLQAAGIARARGLIATTDSDAENVYVILSARTLNRELFLVARASAEGAEKKLVQAGADRVVSPYKMAGRRLAELAVRPRVADFLDAALSHGQLAFSLEEIEIARGGPLDGRTVGQLRDEGIFALAVVHGPDDYEPNPPADRRLGAGESLIVSGSADTLAGLRERA